MCRFLGFQPAAVKHWNAHKNIVYDRVQLSDLPPDVLAGLAPYRAGIKANPQLLNTLQYITPMAADVPGCPTRCATLLSGPLCIVVRVCVCVYCVCLAVCGRVFFCMRLCFVVICSRPGVCVCVC